MTTTELFEKASGGNKEALQFLCAVNRHFDQVHQFIAQEKQDPHEFIALMANTNRVFSFPFYQRYAEQLRVPVLRAVSRLDRAELYDLVIDVAFITIGFEETKKLLGVEVEVVLAKEPVKE